MCADPSSCQEAWGSKMRFFHDHREIFRRCRGTSLRRPPSQRGLATPRGSGGWPPPTVPPPPQPHHSLEARRLLPGASVLQPPASSPPAFSTGCHSAHIRLPLLLLCLWRTIVGWQQEGKGGGGRTATWRVRQVKALVGSVVNCGSRSCIVGRNGKAA